jgi:hypothetical protein
VAMDVLAEDTEELIQTHNLEAARRGL